MSEVCAWFEVLRRKQNFGTRLRNDCYRWETVEYPVSGVSDKREFWRECYWKCHEGAGKSWGRFEQFCVVWTFHRAPGVRGFETTVKWLF
jgi:hypothetical protein